LKEVSAALGAAAEALESEAEALEECYERVFKLWASSLPVPVESEEDLERIREKCARRIERIQEAVRGIFKGLVGGQPRQYIGVCGVKVSLDMGLEAFEKRWEAWKDTLGDLVRDYYRARGCVLLYGRAADRLARVREVVGKLAEGCRRRAEALRGLQALIARRMSEIDSAYKVCQAELGACVRLGTAAIDSVLRGEEPCSGEPKAEEVEGYAARAGQMASDAIYSAVSARVSVEMAKSDAGKALRDLEEAKSLLPLLKKYPIRHVQEVLGDLTEDVESLASEAERTLRWLEEIESDARRLQRESEEFSETVAPRYYRLFKRLRDRLERARSLEECARIMERFWALWGEFKERGRRLLLEAESLPRDPEDPRLEHAVRDLEERRRQLVRLAYEEAKLVKTTLAVVTVLAPLPPEQRSSAYEVVEKIVEEFHSAAQKVGSRVGAVNSILEELERAKVFVRDDVRRAIRASDTALKWTDRALSAYFAAKEFLTKRGTPEDALYKLAACLDIMGAWLPACENPLIGPMLAVYSKALKVMAKFAGYLRKQVAEMLREDIVEMEGLDEKLSDEVILRTDVDALVRHVLPSFEKYLERSTAEEAARAYVLDRLLGIACGAEAR
ncbi:MAG: hypothetical protein DRJ56_06735, partial [Thermoprotei archaeon]